MNYTGLYLHHEISTTEQISISIEIDLHLTISNLTHIIFEICYTAPTGAGVV